MAGKNKSAHLAVDYVLGDVAEEAGFDISPSLGTSEKDVTTLSLARALAVGLLGKVGPDTSSVKIWDPAVGSGLAGSLLVRALESAGVQVEFRGQDINQSAVEKARQRLSSMPFAEVACGNTLTFDAFEGLVPDLVLVDAPWGMDWRIHEDAVETRRNEGSFSFGLPPLSDSVWLFISLALEKLRPTDDGGGRVAALVPISALSGRSTGVVRKNIMDAGLLESVTRLPGGLHPDTNVDPYLLTFSNRPSDIGRRKAVIADLQTQYESGRGFRVMPTSALRELEAALRTRKPGPRNRTVQYRQFTRRDATLQRRTHDGTTLEWKVATYNDTAIDVEFFDTRYGPNAGVSLAKAVTATVDLNPGHIFHNEFRQLAKDIESKGWVSRRLSQFLVTQPSQADKAPDGDVFIPTNRTGRAAMAADSVGPSGRVISIKLDTASLNPYFLAAWLNSDQGVASRWNAIHVTSSGTYIHALRSDARSLMRWADELIVPAPNMEVQLQLAAADEQLSSFRATLDSARDRVWASPELADEVVAKFSPAFDDSLTGWLDELPYPIATALWTAETASSPLEKQQAYMHAWEAVIVFHATVLLAACRSDPAAGGEIEEAIRETLTTHGLSIEKASLGTWVVIVEKTAKALRRRVESDDPDQVAQVRRTFADLGASGVRRMVSKELVQKFNDVNTKRNAWHGHSGHRSERELRTQIDSLESDLRELRAILGNVWAQLPLVRAGRSRRTRDGDLQEVELAVGTRSPFAKQEFGVGDLMIEDALYLARDGAQTPLALGHFVQLREAPSSAQFTTYFYNRTEGSKVRLVSYQHGPTSELLDDADDFREQFGQLTAQ